MAAQKVNLHTVHFCGKVLKMSSKTAYKDVLFKKVIFLVAHLLQLPKQYFIWGKKQLLARAENKTLSRYMERVQILSNAIYKSSRERYYLFISSKNANKHAAL